MTEPLLLKFQFERFQKFPLVHGMSGRQSGAPSDGDLAYGKTSDHANVSLNRKSFFNELGLDLSTLTLGKQVHGTRVVPVLESDKGRGQPPAFDGFPDTDGLVTGDTGVTLGIITGDCVPILLYDPRQHVVGLVHAGWRGTVAQIVKQAVQVMIKGYGCRPFAIQAGIGPSICPACYEVGDEVVDAWLATRLPNARNAVIKRDDRFYFDLWTANRISLINAGVQRWNIEDSGTCTRCSSEHFFSRRGHLAGESPKGSQVMVVQLERRS